MSKNGNYNTTPTWSPRAGTRIVAYTTRDGNYDIVTLDLDTKKMVRITQDEGNNEEPSFSPNGAVIAFARAGKGIFNIVYFFLRIDKLFRCIFNIFPLLAHDDFRQRFEASPSYDRSRIGTEAGGAAQVSVTQGITPNHPRKSGVRSRKRPWRSRHCCCVVAIPPQKQL